MTDHEWVSHWLSQFQPVHPEIKREVRQSLAALERDAADQMYSRAS